MATPLLAALRRRHPTATLTLTGARALKDLVAGGPWMDGYLPWPEGRSLNPLRRAVREWVRELRSLKADCAVTLPNSLRAAMAAWLSGARHRVGFRREGRGFLLTQVVDPPNRRNRGYHPMPLVAYYSALSGALGCGPSGDGLVLYETPQEAAAIEQRLVAEGLLPRNDPLVVMSPGAKFGAAKCWFPERFAAVADRLIEKNGAAVVVTCAPGEEPLARRIGELSRCGVCVWDRPLLTLGEFKSLVARADLLIGNDTGPRHIAKAFGVPTVTIFGPTDPVWTATSHACERILRVDVECGPCQQRICPLKDPVKHLCCMKGVSEEEVLETSMVLLNAPRSTGARLAP